MSNWSSIRHNYSDELAERVCGAKIEKEGAISLTLMMWINDLNKIENIFIAQLDDDGAIDAL